jgi:CRISPR/Cas system-associated protein Csm6
MVTIIKNTDFKRVAKGVKPDAKKRVVLPKALIGEDITYHIYTNSAGQIVLDPQVTIPASELWLFENKEALASIDRGMAESMNGQAKNRGSFAKYVKNVP